jgi:alkylation response protein AidB-like acyl-CoA dehydrogenase
MSIDVPTEYGGTGHTFFDSVLVIEELSKIDPSIGLLVDVHNTLLNRLFVDYGTEEQKHHYLPQLATHLVLLFFILTCINEIVIYIFCFRLVVSV